MAIDQPLSHTPKSTRQSLTGFLKKLGLDGFLLALLTIILLAYLYPAFGKEDGPLLLVDMASYGVGLIFFFYGLRLSPEKLRVGLSSWRLHLVVQLSTFLLFPLLVWAAKKVLGTPDQELLWLGALYLAALPSTVSSSVVMVSIAGGNIPAAIFNASISSLVGVFMTPLWMTVFMETTAAHEMDLGTVIGKLMVQVLLPVTLGILLHKRFGAFAEKHKARLRLLDQAIILLIVYTSFCESFAREMFRGYSWASLLVLGVSMVALFFFVLGLIFLLSTFLNFNREDRITAVFCGSKKSLVHGTVMSKVLFPDANLVGIVLLPLMLYHALQLISASILAQKMARNQAALLAVEPQEE
ncbi:bile acid:sodium symporter family protein [Rufibacter radiotolerans]|uniref:bile acid:sodium symporter family protein n=1 Tax=Rufibacter radiotolerans TaxID=1379910 RepID=UPI0009E4D847|nr:bile acid:sodium symporter family protein [Rufibacter radiotolerans]